MTLYTDLTVEPHFAHHVAEWVAGGTYNDIALYQFHRALDPSGIWNRQEGFQAFVDLSKGHYKGIVGVVDDCPAVIGVAVRLGGQWSGYWPNTSKPMNTSQ